MWSAGLPVGPVGTYRPLALASFVIDHKLGGGQAWLFHLSSVLLHGLTAVMLFRVLARLLPLGARPPNTRPDPAADRRAAWALAAIWAVHPAAVEAVAWINGRSELFALLFGLVALLLALPPKGGPPGDWRRAGRVRSLAAGRSRQGDRAGVRPADALAGCPARGRLPPTVAADSRRDVADRRRRHRRLPGHAQPRPRPGVAAGGARSAPGDCRHPRAVDAGAAGGGAAARARAHHRRPLDPGPVVVGAGGLPAGLSGAGSRGRVAVAPGTAAGGRRPGLVGAGAAAGGAGRGVHLARSDALAVPGPARLAAGRTAIAGRPPARTDRHRRRRGADPGGRGADPAGAAGVAPRRRAVRHADRREPGRSLRLPDAGSDHGPGPQLPRRRRPVRPGPLAGGARPRRRQLPGALLGGDGPLPGRPPPVPAVRRVAGAPRSRSSRRWTAACGRIRRLDDPAAARARRSIPCRGCWSPAPGRRALRRSDG